MAVRSKALGHVRIVCGFARAYLTRGHHSGIIACSVLGVVVQASESAECAAHFNRNYGGLHWLFYACVLLMGVFAVILFAETTAVVAVALSQVHGYFCSPSTAKASFDPACV